MIKQELSNFTYSLVLLVVILLGCNGKNSASAQTTENYKQTTTDSLQCVIEKLQFKNDSLIQVIKKSKKVTYKQPSKQNQQYIDKYLSYAKEAQRLYGIPVSITLAQGMLESACGTSKLAINKNNHFGIKCGFEYKFFESIEQCFCYHAELLSKRYKISSTSYIAWAHNLKKKGYAEDPLYAEKLIAKIQQNNLNQYDA